MSRQRATPSKQVFFVLPCVLSILALIVMSRRAAYPKALMVPYRKGER